MCGEQNHRRKRTQSRLGSPPRVRGTGKLNYRVFAKIRITPACAGNRSNGTADTARHGDHPRVCGEQRLTSTCKADVQGSPPRVRGTDYVRDVCNFTQRITPACAGNRLRNLRKYAVLFSLRVTFPSTSQRSCRSSCSLPQPCAAVQTRSLNAPQPLPN